MRKTPGFCTKLFIFSLTIKLKIFQFLLILQITIVPLCVLQGFKNALQQAVEMVDSGSNNFEVN